MRYKVGDKVLIRQWDDMAKEFGVDDDGEIPCDDYFTLSMKHFCGTVQEIKEIDYDAYHLVSDYAEYCFTDDMIERKVNEMTKADLRTGHIVTLRNGQEYSVMLSVAIDGESDVLENLHDNEFVYLSHYDDNMRCENNVDFDVVKVRKPCYFSYIGHPDEDRYGDLVYERKEPKEMTIAEIEKLLGYPVKIVKE